MITLLTESLQKDIESKEHIANQPHEPARVQESTTAARKEKAPAVVPKNKAEGFPAVVTKGNWVQSLHLAYMPLWKTSPKCFAMLWVRKKKLSLLDSARSFSFRRFLVTIARTRKWSH